jgi:hypothetical protein
MPDRKAPLHSPAASWDEHARMTRMQHARRRRRAVATSSGMLMAGGLGVVAWCIAALSRSLGFQ